MHSFVNALTDVHYWSFRDARGRLRVLGPVSLLLARILNANPPGSFRNPGLHVGYPTGPRVNTFLQCVSKTSPTFLAVTRESIVGFS